MFIKTVKLNNFMPYYGLAEIQFPKENDEKNIYLITGDNGFGKTSFLSAIKWAFFGGKGTTNNNRMHNTKALLENQNDMLVSVVFEENGQTFNLTRKQKTGEAEELSLGLIRDNYENDIAQEKIMSIFPENTAQFFIFEGEMVRELAKAQGQHEARSSIEILLGLQALRNAVEDLQKLESEYRNDLSTMQSNLKEYQDIEKQYKAALDKQEEIDGELSTKNSELINLTDAEVRYEKELSKIEEKKGLVKEKEEALSSLQGLEQDLINLNDEQKDLAKNSFLLFILKDIQETRRFLEDELKLVEEKEKRIMYQTVKRDLIQSSIDNDECELCKSSPVDTEKLKSSLDPTFESNLSTNSRTSSTIKEEIGLLNIAYFEASEKVAKPLQKVIRDIGEVKDEINAKKQRIERLKTELGGEQSSSQKSTIEKLYRETQNRKNIVEYRIGELQEQKGEWRKKAQDLFTQRKRLGNVDDKYERKVKQRILTEKAQEAFEEILSKSVHMNRNRILDSSNEFFNRLTNKPNEYDRFKFATEETFEFQIVRKDETEPNMEMISDGEKEIVAFSFIMGLSKYSQIKAPLIMDNVNSRLDGQHRNKLAKLLGSLNNQVIMLGIDKDFDYDTRQIMKDNINKEYEIVRGNDEYSELLTR